MNSALRRLTTTTQMENQASYMAGYLLFGVLEMSNIKGSHRVTPPTQTDFNYKITFYHCDLHNLSILPCI